MATVTEAQRNSLRTALKTGQLQFAECIALAKPTQTEATAEYRRTSAGVNITHGGVTYFAADGITSSIATPDSSAELTHEDASVKVPDPTFSIRLDIDRTGHLGWTLHWKRLAFVDGAWLLLESGRGLLDTYPFSSDTRELQINVTGPYNRYDRKTEQLMTDGDQRRRGATDTSLSRVGEARQIKLGRN